MIVRLAYIAQIDLPGGPIKVGSSCRVRERMHAFSGGTPCDCRLIGVTFPGIEREQQMLDATKSAIIKGEWRHATPELFRLIRQWVDAGEWRISAPSKKAHYRDHDVASRAIAAGLPNPNWGHWQAPAIATNVADSDPSLLADWHGFAVSREFPDFAFPRRTDGPSTSEKRAA